MECVCMVDLSSRRPWREARGRCHRQRPSIFLFFFVSLFFFLLFFAFFVFYVFYVFYIIHARWARASGFRTRSCGSGRPRRQVDPSPAQMPRLRELGMSELGALSGRLEPRDAWWKDSKDRGSVVAAVGSFRRNARLRGKRRLFVLRGGEPWCRRRRVAGVGSLEGTSGDGPHEGCRA